MIMKKYVFVAILGVLVVAGVLGGVKALQINKMMAQSAHFQQPPEPVTATQVVSDSWETRLNAVGSLSAVQGVTVTAELPGKVVEIAFVPGTRIAAGALLLRQDTSSELAMLPGTEAAVVLAQSILDRARRLLIDEAVSQAEVDAAQARYLQALADVENLRATIAKKNIRTPFAGRLGIRQVNLGQMLEAGNQIVSLQALDPIYVDFLLPQQQLLPLQQGLVVRITTDALPGKALEGKITTISPMVDEATRNIRVQGLIRNPEEWLRPGMYVDVAVILPQRKDVLMIPITAVLYAPYSDSVFVIEEASGDQTAAGEGRPPAKQLRQQFVHLGEKRGDFIEVLSGLQAGETVVTTGVFKLRNKQAVVVDNSLQPEFKLQPEPEDR
jgi:membrane fusion protein (multidrug efflux system)